MNWTHGETEKKKKLETIRPVSFSLKTPAQFPKFNICRLSIAGVPWTTEKRRTVFIIFPCVAQHRTPKSIRRKLKLTIYSFTEWTSTERLTVNRLRARASFQSSQTRTHDKCVAGLTRSVYAKLYNNNNASNRRISVVFFFAFSFTQNGFWLSQRLWLCRGGYSTEYIHWIFVFSDW